MFEVPLASSVIESPSVTTEPSCVSVATLRSSMNHQLVVLVVKFVAAVSAAWSPAAARVMYEVCLAPEW